MNKLLLNRRRSMSRSKKKLVEKKQAVEKKEQPKEQPKKESNEEYGYIKGMYMRDSETGKKFQVKATPEMMNLFGNNFREVDIPDNVKEIAINMLNN